MKKLLVWLCVMGIGLLSLPVAEMPVQAEEQITLKIYNWGEYISDGSEDTLHVIQEFQKRYPNIRVSYDVYASNEEMYAKLKSGSAQYDVLIPSDYMISRLIQENMLEKLDFDHIPNISDVSEPFLNPDYDPDNAYSVPYAWGLVGIIYNKTMVEQPVDSWSILWDEEYRDNILMFDNPRDAFGIALKWLGYSQNTTDLDQLDQAAAKLILQKELIQAYVMDQIFDKMTNGEAAVAPYYAGDALTMIEENEDLDFAFPQEGTNRFVDAMVIPKDSPNKQAAETFINFMLEPEIAYANISAIGYSTPMDSVKEIMDPETLSNPIAYPPAEVLQNTEGFIHLPESVNVYMQQLWNEVKTSGSNSLVEFLFLIVVSLGAGICVIIYLRKRNPN